jgi:hypothetical protein
LAGGNPVRQFLFEDPNDLAHDEMGTVDTIYSNIHVQPVADPQRCNVALFISDTTAGTPGGHQPFALSNNTLSGAPGVTTTFWWNPNSDPGASSNALTGWSCQWLGLFHAVGGDGTIWDYNCGGANCGPGPAFASGTWYHIAIAANRTNGTARGYINGAPLACAAPAGSSSFSFSSLVYNAVCYPTPGIGMADRGMTGLFDDVRIYNRLLSDAEVLQLYQQSQ